MKHTDFIHGPFVVLAQMPDNDGFPQAIGPFQTREAADDFTEHWKGQDRDLELTIIPMRDGGSFMRFMSW